MGRNPNFESRIHANDRIESIACLVSRAPPFVVPCDSKRHYAAIIRVIRWIRGRPVCLLFFASFPNSGLGMTIPEASLRRAGVDTATFNRDAQL